MRTLVLSVWSIFHPLGERSAGANWNLYKGGGVRMNGSGLYSRGERGGGSFGIEVHHKVAGGDGRSFCLVTDDCNRNGAERCSGHLCIF